jgi:hypothetical protein
MKAFLNQQLRENDEKIVVLMKDLELEKNNQWMINEWQDITKKSEEIAQGIQEQLKERVTMYDNLVNKHVMMRKKLIILKRASKGKKSADKKLIASLKKKRDNVKKRFRVQKEKNRLVNLNIEEERRLRTPYMAQADDEREVRKAVESNMRDYQDITNGLRE